MTVSLYPLRLSQSLHQAAALAAAREGLSLNQFFATAIAEKVAIAQAMDAETQGGDGEDDADSLS